MKRKKLVVILTAAIVLLAFAVIAAARAELCPQCGGRITIKKSTEYDIVEIDRFPCSKTEEKFDSEITYKYDVSYTCSTVGCPETYTETLTGRRIVCGH